MSWEVIVEPRSTQGIVVKFMVKRGYKIWRSPGLPITSYPMELINEEKNLKIVFDGLTCKVSTIVLSIVECSISVPAFKMDDEYLSLTEAVLLRLINFVKPYGG
jgi:hypothetical protein